MGAQRDISTAVEEIGLSGHVGIGRCCKSTLKNWVNDINDYLEANHFDWRVVGQWENKMGSILPIKKECYDAAKTAMKK